MAHMQRILVTTIDREAADSIYKVMNAVSWIDDAHMPSFTDHGDTFTVQHTVPVVPGNWPMTQMWAIIARYIESITSYDSTPA